MRKSVLLAVVMILGMAGLASAQPHPARIDSVGHGLVEGPPGAAVIGLLRGDTSSVHAFGAVDSTGGPPTRRTVFEIGSVTKTFTGLLLALAVEDGSLRPSTPVRTLLPDSIHWTLADSLRGSGRSSRITLEALATHRSGLPRIPSNLLAHAAPGDPYVAYDDSALYAFLDGHELTRPPGTRYAYSNLGMGLLGHVLARRADTTYAALVQERIASPLGLSDTRVELTPDQRTRFAQGHTRAGAPAAPWHFDALAGAGALRSTAADMLAYLRTHRNALRAQKDTASTLTRAMQRALRPRAETSQDSTRIGLAWHRTLHNGRPIVWHNGGTGGFRSFVGFDRETGVGAVVLVSTAGSSGTVFNAAINLIENIDENYRPATGEHGPTGAGSVLQWLPTRARPSTSPQTFRCTLCLSTADLLKRPIPASSPDSQNEPPTRWMFSTLAAYLLVGVHVFFPPFLAYRLWRHRFDTLGAWGLEAAFTVVALGMLFVIGRWDIVGLPLRYWICGGSMVAAAASIIPISDRPLYSDDGIRWRWGAAVEGSLLAALLIWGLVGMSAERPAVDLASPLRGERYYVAHGGSTPPINYHGAFAESQTYALDINQLNDWGARAAGIHPSRLSKYAVYGDTVYAPLSGTVVEAVDSLPDLRPPDKQPEHPAGNHVWIRRDSLYVVLAHLKQESARVRAGDYVEAGQPLAQVGNTGNTTEPHLHLHAVTYPGGPPAHPDSLARGRPVPLTINGRFLVRNDRLSPQ